MKCLRCSTDNNLKERQANYGRCKNCNHTFAFEPVSMGGVKVTDAFFQKVLNDISVNNTLFYTPKQFLYFLDKRLKAKWSTWGELIVTYLFLGVFFIGVFGGVFSKSELKLSSFPIVSIIYNIIWIFNLFKVSNSQGSNYNVRRNYAIMLSIQGVFILIIGLVSSLFTDNSNIFLASVILGLLALLLGILQRIKARKIPNALLFGTQTIESWLERWASINNPITKLLSAPQLTISNTINTEHPDVTSYSFDRLVVSSSNEIAQMLIANNFHFENNCAILSINGYPSSIFDTVMQMLRRNPELTVYALHNASPWGVELVHQLRTSPTWFGESQLKIIDLGLSPRQIIKSRRSFFVRNGSKCAEAAQKIAPEVRQTLTKAELAWLEAGNFVELESFTPSRLIKILNRGITKSQAIDFNDSEEESIIYAVESFG